ncbi:MAG: [FeFe] hydrogenase H-cluster radical SAM maturase HydE [Alphaproteobacteria bacterium]|nr:[FeFe] hydrogenase H-cluster radical SAM maturase HydE [Alphaproteobacteria bacterium]
MNLHTRKEIFDILTTPSSNRQELYSRADAVRKENMGDEIPLRGIIEFTNICSNDCIYCGIRASNSKVARYKITDEEILEVARKMPKWQQWTVVLQSGEADSKAENLRIGNLIERIKKETGLAVTLSVGNRSKDVFAFWRNCGADRYLMRFETSDKELFEKIHPDCTLKERLECLDNLREAGYQVGSGFMIGIPGETIETLADNINLCSTYDLDMIGIGPFIPHEETPLAGQKNIYDDDKDMFFAAVSALRIFNPLAHIPATTAFDAVFPNTGRDLALQRGANVFMANNTPEKYRDAYLIYPNKPFVDETGDEYANALINHMKELGRSVATGYAHSKKCY